jgi:hypothetical protein
MKPVQVLFLLPTSDRLNNRAQNLGGQFDLYSTGHGSTSRFHDIVVKFSQCR